MDKLFYILSALTLISAFMVVLSRHPIRSIIYLVITFFLISAHYILLNAQFLALVNVVVYAGAIMVLFLFVVMFLNLNRDIERFQNYLPVASAVISGGAIFLICISAYRTTQLTDLQSAAGDYQVGLVENLGLILYRDYLFPMEICSILFLVAMIGVVLLSRKEKAEPVKSALP